MNTKNNSRETLNPESPSLTFDELQNLRDAISDIMLARDFLSRNGIDVGSLTTNNIYYAHHQLPNEEDCIDYPY
jgi:hypothetical protein